jgi:oligoribonuclease
VTDQLVWIDCEMTGLDLASDALVEIACIVTDAELNPLDDGIDIVIKPPAEAIDGMLPVVRDMHTTSGLLAELPSGVTLAEAQELVLAYVRQHVPESAGCRCVATRSRPTGRSSPGTCPSWTLSCTTA